jgi:hypothetical protein
MGAEQNSLVHEDLLTQEEIQLVIVEVKKPEWENRNLMGVGGKKTSIFRISLPTGLIMIRGNKYTGLDHIEERHRFGQQTWREDKDELIVSSEFRFGVSPFDLIHIAESVYKPDNSRLDLNNRPDEFDLYVGTHIYKNGDPADFRLLTYKGTSIIHTLFPVKTDNPRKKLLSEKKHKDLLKYRQCRVGMTFDARGSLHTYTIPYKNKAGQEVFQVLIRGIDRYPLERWYVQINEGSLAYPQTVFIKEIVLRLPVEHGFIRSIYISDGIKIFAEVAALAILSNKFDYNKEDILHTFEGRTGELGPTYFSW